MLVHINNITGHGHKLNSMVRGENKSSASNGMAGCGRKADLSLKL